MNDASTDQVRAAMSELGRKGGRATGVSKVRGGVRYYRAIARKGAAAPHTWRFRVERWDGTKWATPDWEKHSFRSYSAAEREIRRRLATDLSPLRVWDADEQRVMVEVR